MSVKVTFTTGATGAPAARAGCARGHGFRRLTIVLAVDAPMGFLSHDNETRWTVLQRILVVCVGNICRSPTAEILFRRRVPGLVVSSAGLCALGGNPMDATARAVLAAHGLDGSRHVARQLHGHLIAQADLILCMEKAQVEAIEHTAPHAQGRIFVLDHWRRQADIPDPYGRPRPAFERAYVMIDAAVSAWLPHLHGR